MYADGMDGVAPEKIMMSAGLPLEKDQEYVFHAQIVTTRPAGDYTARIIPRYENISVPLEDNLIRWQH